MEFLFKQLQNANFLAAFAAAIVAYFTVMRLAPFGSG